MTQSLDCTLLLVSVTLPEGDNIPVHLPEMERDVETQCQQVVLGGDQTSHQMIICMIIKMVVTPDTDWFPAPPRHPQYSKTANFKVAFYCGQPKAHLCNNHAV